MNPIRIAIVITFASVVVAAADVTPIAPRAKDQVANAPENLPATETPKAPVPPGFALIPAGEFMMGDALDGDKYAPQHKVIVQGFYMQKTEVTKAQWTEVWRWAIQHGYTDLAKGDGKAADHPVIDVSWYAVAKWCNARSEKEGLIPCYYIDAAQTEVYRRSAKYFGDELVKWGASGYRLPTEAEWEKAARGSLVGKRFPWGDTISQLDANFENSGQELFQAGSIGFHPIYGKGKIPYTSPVGSFAANGYGLYDMAGNVWEFCWDLYEDSTAALEKKPQGTYHSCRVLRGGAWSDSARSCLTAAHSNRRPYTTDFDIGFRPVRR